MGRGWHGLALAVSSFVSLACGGNSSENAGSGGQGGKSAAATDAAGPVSSTSNAGGTSGGLSDSTSTGSGLGGATTTDGGATDGGTSSTSFGGAQGGSAAGGESSTATTAGGEGGMGSDCDCAPSDLQCAIRCRPTGDLNSGDCKDDLDCDGGSCVELSAGGYRVCTNGPLEVQGCAGEGSLADECCTSGDCEAGLCVRLPGPTYCGGPFIEEHNACASDECQNADDCSHHDNGVCFPAGAYGYPVATCAAGACQTDDDCSDEKGGLCLLVQSPCCATRSLACVYPGGCRSLADCPDSSNSCQIEDGRAVCSDALPVCPA